MNKFLRLIGATRVEKECIEFKWGYIAKGLSFQLKLHRGGYFDSRYAVSIGLIFGYIHIYLPFKTKLGEGCTLPQYGIAIHNNTFWIYLGGKFDESWGQVTQEKWITWNLPWFTWEFDNHWIMNKEGKYQIPQKVETPMKDGTTRLEQDYEYKFALKETVPYKYTLRSGEIQEITATIFQEKRQWHRKWFPFIKMVKVDIDVAFSDEVGERAGSWKGGVVGTSYKMLKGETPLETLRRMESERVFK
jgi:hypothetical protein